VTNHDNLRSQQGKSTKLISMVAASDSVPDALWRDD
jgi:hypothetical protein